MYTHIFKLPFLTMVTFHGIIISNFLFLSIFPQFVSNKKNQKAIFFAYLCLKSFFWLFSLVYKKFLFHSVHNFCRQMYTKWIQREKYKGTRKCRGHNRKGTPVCDVQRTIGLVCWWFKIQGMGSWHNRGTQGLWLDGIRHWTLLCRLSEWLCTKDKITRYIHI